MYPESACGASFFSSLVRLLSESAAVTGDPSHELFIEPTLPRLNGDARTDSIPTGTSEGVNIMLGRPPVLDRLPPRPGLLCLPPPVRFTSSATPVRPKLLMLSPVLYALLSTALESTVEPVDARPWPPSLGASPATVPPPSSVELPPSCVPLYKLLLLATSSFICRAVFSFTVVEPGRNTIPSCIKATVSSVSLALREAGRERPTFENAWTLSLRRFDRDMVDSRFCRLSSSLSIFAAL